jgi:hypothetical protein
MQVTGFFMLYHQMFISRFYHGWVNQYIYVFGIINARIL